MESLGETAGLHNAPFYGENYELRLFCGVTFLFSQEVAG